MIEQLILHLFGDYVTQSHWMATGKTTRWKPALAHAVVYSIPFLLLGPSLLAFAVILGTHFLIDRYRVARIVVYLKNSLGDPDFWRGVRSSYRASFGQGQEVHDANSEKFLGPVIDQYATSTGYPESVPPWMSVWLLIAADNALHLAINYAALTWL